ncbi:LysR family transcriptional regulator [Curvibacter delicatus]|jgi:DNA-binding transcriptional LysR family regulator|uniref:LysR family transcriptional regulator n=1 Tax=Curvibacter delicatus TaxID=80879 RepID=UPI00082C3414|nr:LysR family transcriptional regulator [Curvibacter delicatus]
MDFRQLQYFLTLYEEGSMTKAASRLNVVQPAISMQVAKLEDEVDQKLFTRSTRGMTPTPAGRQMYQLFRPIMADFSRARALIHQTDGELSGHLAIGVIASVAQGVMANVIADYSTHHPRVTLSVSDGYTPALCQAVTEGELDAAIINQPRRRLSLDIHPVLSEDFVLATGPLHKRIGESISLRQVAKLKLVLPTRYHGQRDILDSFALAEGLELNPAIEIDSINAILQLVETTAIATILPRIVARGPAATGRLKVHKIVDPSLTRQVVCVTHPRRPPSPAASALIAFLVKHTMNNRHPAERATT